MSSVRCLLAALCAYALLAASVQAEELPVATPLFPQCPLSLHVGDQSYPLNQESLYLGSIESKFEVIPNAVPADYSYNDGPDFWLYEACPKFPLALKCYYQGTFNYMVLELRGMRRCTRTDKDDDKRIKCE